MSTKFEVKQLFIYPIKSLAGIECKELNAQEMGFENDRRWMLIDENNEFVTQRVHPKMSQFYPKIVDDRIEIRYQNALHEFQIEEYIGEQIHSKVWDDSCQVFEVNPNTSKWFTDQLGFVCKLVKIINAGDRKHNSSKLNQNLNVSLADGYPYLLLGTKSLEFLNDKLEEKITIHRFRPNIVIETNFPHEEDDLTDFAIDQVEFKNVKPCGRCVMVNTNPINAEVKKEPLKTLSTYRKVDNSILFATNVMCLNSGKIQVGDFLIKN
ncbi:MOSC domain-containing protein [Flavobacterium agrisoli]|uniref:MOSC domain-containing protein n=1 Tax=Flavobacterium agrisoli TaxID=2793066 RepID=A0A934PQ25_9FLAO|nr:MOSC N-terminal beta barrel domain-containing protein [Flavobacterium agrisoli]MBK0371003.1 MOSC domain-containing protein [Flavobacterium agrisoli]